MSGSLCGDTDVLKLAVSGLAKFMPHTLALLVVSNTISKTRACLSDEHHAQGVYALDL
jgi:hypothetical protein